MRSRLADMGCIISALRERELLSRSAPCALIRPERAAFSRCRSLYYEGHRSGAEISRLASRLRCSQEAFHQETDKGDKGVPGLSPGSAGSGAIRRSHGAERSELTVNHLTMTGVYPWKQTSRAARKRAIRPR